jgi:nitrite reductase (NO-forming)
MRSWFPLIVAGGLALAACAPSASSAVVADSSPSAETLTPTVSYTLVTGGGTGRMVFVGQGGTIDGQENPTLSAQVGDVVELTLVNGDTLPHDLAIDEFGVHLPQIQNLDDSAQVTFVVDRAGDFAYYCTLPGHRQAGMEGSLHVGPEP